MESNLTSPNRSQQIAKKTVKQTATIPPPLTKKLSRLLADVINLATYALEAGRLPDVVSFSELYRLWDKKIEKEEKLSAEDIDYLQFCYQQLEVQLSPISAISLRATDVSGARKSKDYMNSAAGIHAKHMWIMAFSILGLVIGINLYQYTFDMYAGDWAVESPETFGNLTILYWLAGSLTPFAYGAFGASVRLLRITETRLRERSFDPRRIAEHRNRLVLGTLSGGVVVLIYSTGGVGDSDIKLTEAGIGFLAGYSIDLLFSILDRVVDAISPDQSPSSSKAEKPVGSGVKKTFAEIQIEKAVSIVDSVVDPAMASSGDESKKVVSDVVGDVVSDSAKNIITSHLKSVHNAESSKKTPAS